MRTNYNWRISSQRENSSLKPQTFTITLGNAMDAACQHSKELGCQTMIEQKRDDIWVEWVTFRDSTPDKFNYEP